MAKSLNKFFILVLFFVSTTVFAQEPQIWGSADYGLTYSRIDDDFLTAFSLTNPEEPDRWLSSQDAALTVNFRYGSLLEASVSADVAMTGSQTQLAPAFSMMYIQFFPVDWLALTVGKQRLKWGTAKVFSSIENIDEMADPSSNNKTLDGIAGIKAQIIPSDWYSFTLLAIPEEDLRWTRGALRMDLLIVDADVGLGVVKYNSKIIKSVVYNALLPDIATYKTTDQFLVFLDASRYFGDLGVFIDAEVKFKRDANYALFNGIDYTVYSPSEDFEPVLKATAALSYSVKYGSKNQINLLAEYHYDGEGLTDRQAKDFDALYSGVGQMQDMFVPSGLLEWGNFRQHYGYLGFSGWVIADKIFISTGVIANFETLSMNIRPSLNYEINDNVSLTFNYNCFVFPLDKTDFVSEFQFIPFRQSAGLYVKASF